jgi:Flp pilus assembly protein TadG
MREGSNRYLFPVMTRVSSSRARRLAAASLRLREERGAAMVEFAIVVPVLLLIVVGILYFGRFLNYSSDATHLASEAARWAAVNVNPGSTNQLPCSSLQTCVQVQADSGEFQQGTGDVSHAAKVCITFPNGSANVGDPVQATVSATFQVVPFLNLSIPVQEVATMRLEQPASNYTAGCSS